MRILNGRVVMAAVVAAWACGCGDGDRPGPPPPSPAASGGAAASPLSVEGVRSPAPGRGADPGSPESAPRWTPERLKALARTDMPGYLRQAERASSTAALPQYESVAVNSQGVKVGVVVHAGPCEFCQPMDLTLWKAGESNLKAVLPPAHLANPDLVFEVYEIDLGARRGIASYRRSFVESTSDSGTTRSSSHGMTVWWNDGASQVVLDLQPRGQGVFVRSAEELAASISRADLEAVAREFMAVWIPAVQ